MDKLSFENLYKFLVSLGVLLIAAPVLAVTFFLNADVQLITKKEYDELQDYSVHVIQLKDKIVTGIDAHYKLIWIAIAIGIIFFLIGIIGWCLTQHEKDEQEKTKTKLLKLQWIKQQTPIDIHKKEEEIIREVKEDKISDTTNTDASQSDSNSDDEIVHNSMQYSVGNNNNIESVSGKFRYDTIKDYWKYYELYFIKYINNKEYDLKTNVKVGSSRLDAVAIAKDDKESDILFEVKWKPNVVSRKDLLNAARMLKSHVDEYTNMTRRNCKGRVVVITSKEQVEKTYLWELEYKDEYKDVTVTLIPQDVLTE